MNQAAEPAPSAPERERMGGVIGVGVSLLVIVGLVLGLVVTRAKPLDPGELFTRWFEPTELSHGLVAAEAARDASGTEMLRLENPGAAPETPALEVEPSAKKRSKKSTNEEPETDWRSIEVGPVGTAPIEALFLTWPLRRASARLDALFSNGSSGGRSDRRGSSRGPGFKDLYEGLGDDGGRRVLARGRIPWGEFEAPFVHVREFEPGGTFVDTLRMNLSTESEALALLLRWPRGFPAGEEQARELLEGLVRRAPQG